MTTVKLCRANIGRYDDLCGLRAGHDGPCLDEFAVKICGLDIDGKPTPEETERRAKMVPRVSPTKANR
jgi:hypothetical protein